TGWRAAAGRGNGRLGGRGTRGGARQLRADLDRARLVCRARQRGGSGAPARHRSRQPVPADAAARPRASPQRGGMTRFPPRRPAAEHSPGAARPMHLPVAPPTKAPPMRPTVLTLVCLVVPAVARAQDTAIVINPESVSVAPQPGDLPRLVAEEAIRFYNAATTTRLVGRSRLPRGNGWPGGVAGRNGAVSVGGRIQGTLLVINGDASVDSGAVISGDLIV